MVEGKRSEQCGNSGIDSPDRGEVNHLFWGQKRTVLLGGI